MTFHRDLTDADGIRLQPHSAIPSSPYFNEAWLIAHITHSQQMLSRTSLSGKFSSLISYTSTYKSRILNLQDGHRGKRHGRTALINHRSRQRLSRKGYWGLVWVV